MFADQMAVFQIVMFGEELIEALDLVGRHESHGQMDKNLLFIGRGLAKAVGFFASATFLVGIRGSVGPLGVGPVHCEPHSTGVDTQGPNAIPGASAIL